MNIDWGKKITAAGANAAALSEKRAAARMSKTDFAEAVFTAGIITESEFIAFAGGELPAKVLTAMEAQLSGVELAKAKARAKAATSIPRNSPIISLIQLAYELTPNQVDEIFGIGNSA